MKTLIEPALTPSTISLFKICQKWKHRITWKFKVSAGRTKPNFQSGEEGNQQNILGAVVLMCTLKSCSEKFRTIHWKMPAMNFLKRFSSEPTIENLKGKDQISF